jgi:subtilisin-like proprotein convertase family protein
MSYVGICDARNLQQYSQDNFHVRSLTSIITYVNNDQNGGATCGTPQATGNNVPVIAALTAYTIPKLTPFTLTASATDADAGDSLTYLWEEYDLAPSASGPNGTPANTYDVDTDGVERPLFRNYSPSTSPSRTFPSLTYILNNVNQPPLTFMGTSPVGAVCEAGIECVIGENLPSIARTMNFRVSVRDNRSPAGAIADAGTTVTVVNTPGPFKITSQNQNPATWQGQSQQTVTWDVSATDQPPISTANVNIRLSTDGGLTFPTTLAANTPNDGSQMITVPNTATTSARIKVEAAGNIFFDINDANFSITTSARRTLTDFDGDGKTDVSIFRPNPTGFAENLGPEGSSSQWWILRSGDVSALGIAFGTPSDVLVPADFTGDGKTDVAFFRPSTGTWFVLRSEDSTFYAFPFGSNGDIPAPGDFDGDGKSDPAVYRPSSGTWFILRSSDSGTSAVPFGIAEDRPTVADFDGDGKADIAQYRPSVNQWWQLRSTAGVIGYQFGASGDKTAIGDYTGDGKADIAFYRPSTSEWFVIRSEDASFFAFPWGAAGDISAPGDYDGDGTTDAAVFRPSNNTWFINGSTSGFQAVPFGTTGDVPLPNSYAYSGQSISSFPGTGVGAIPDGGAGPRAYGAPRNVSFNVSGLNGSTSSVEVDFNASHTYIGDLKVTLIAPNNTQHKLFETTGAGTVDAAGFGTDLSSANTYTFRDSSANNWWTWVQTGDPVPTGNARTVVSGGAGVPNIPMVTSLNTSFSGVAPNGIWVLRFEDGFSGDTGTVSAANLRIGAS